jgi:hypothetical protein
MSYVREAAQSRIMLAKRSPYLDWLFCRKRRPSDGPGASSLTCLHTDTSRVRLPSTITSSILLYSHLFEGKKMADPALINAGNRWQVVTPNDRSGVLYIVVFLSFTYSSLTFIARCFIKWRVLGLDDAAICAAQVSESCAPSRGFN